MYLYIMLLFLYFFNILAFSYVLMIFWFEVVVWKFLYNSFYSKNNLNNIDLDYRFSFTQLLLHQKFESHIYLEYEYFYKICNYFFMSNFIYYLRLVIPHEKDLYGYILLLFKNKYVYCLHKTDSGFVSVFCWIFFTAR